MSAPLTHPSPEPVLPASATVPVGANGPRPTEPDIVVPATPAPSRNVGSEPLARIEDKASRIEEKLARSEAAMQRVADRFEVASSRMSEVALQADLTALRSEVAALTRRVSRTAGPGALLVTAVVTAILSAAAIVLALRYAPALLAR